ncbi:hypothetical protein BmR1_04g06640 [Babesia microti strain RI]|uniref:RanBP2-type domain-containing protein n=1 Tax=Babesia microti (strain RI) TaxID=1133968 RepID=I7I9S0_BABMR|nr:hypothetical protein BmR1_04g06640 [Babesia microti strain RI]CCF75524.1 hypothetical protein BmR1_04g06640 [Babesia microti strain RI]|eukprot:XP_012649932.1 hypothetical protein BmR1_04g06640 [Babesia microti strain RI]
MYSQDKSDFHGRYKDHHGDRYRYNYHSNDNHRDRYNHKRSCPSKSDHSTASYSRHQHFTGNYKEKRSGLDSDHHSFDREKHTSSYGRDIYRNSRRSTPDNHLHRSIYDRQSDRKYNDEDEEDNDGRNIAEITGLDKSIVEKDIEEVIRQISIKNGFSPPNSVTILFNDNKTASNFTTTCGATAFETNKAHIEFPSSIVVNKFLKSLKIPKIKIKGNYYPVIQIDRVIPKNSDDIIIGQSSSTGTIQIKNSMIKMFCDWNCPSCNYFNFSKRIVCLQCNMPRPEEFQQQSLSFLTNISNLTNEYSSWIVIKDVPYTLAHTHFIELLDDILPDITGLERLYYFSDKIHGLSMGFLFAAFTSKDCLSSYFNLVGTKCTSQQLNGTPLRVDLMLLKEQVVASDLVNRIKFDSVHKQSVGNKNGDKKYCKIYNTTIECVEILLKSIDMKMRFSGYVSNWMGKTIWFSSGSIDSDRWPIDKTTNYQYNSQLNLYYDQNTRYYMLASGGYFVWDGHSSCLVRVEPTSSTVTSTNNNTSTDVSTSNNDKCMNDIPVSIRVLEEARKMARASQSFRVAAIANNVDNVSRQFIADATDTDEACTDVPLKSKSTIITTASVECNNLTSRSKGVVDNTSSTYGIKISTTFTNRLKTAHSSILDDKAMEMELESTCSGNEISVQLICFICLRYFDNIDQLHRHEKLSEYHKFITSQS